ncbi:cyclin-like protein [Crassisporium funariophilum]|nr:cyclin-like protein [Crassisporium funariophilum]
MEIDEPELPPPSAEPSSVASVASRAKHVEDEEVGRVFKKRHTDEKPTLLKETQIHDESQADADKVAAELEPEQTSASAQLWDDLDAEDWDDPVMVSEYVVDVCVYLKELELATLPNPDYMNEQNEITWEHRGVLIDWLLQVHARFSLNSESLFLTVNVLDRFLGMRSISISKLQLVGLASFFIATKFEETYAPSVKEIAYLADDQYTVEEILKAERYILKSIEWDLRAPGPLGWLRRASKADECEVHARTIAKYLIEIGLLEHKMIGVVSSKVSAAALWLARMTLGREEWTANLEHYTTFSEKELLPVANMMLEYIIIDPVPHDSLYKKYAHKKYFRVSHLSLLNCLPPTNVHVRIIVQHLHESMGIGPLA